MVLLLMCSGSVEPSLGVLQTPTSQPCSVPGAPNLPTHKSRRHLLFCHLGLPQPAWSAQLCLIPICFFHLLVYAGSCCVPSGCNGPPGAFQNLFPNWHLENQIQSQAKPRAQVRLQKHGPQLLMGYRGLKH